MRWALDTCTTIHLGHGEAEVCRPTAVRMELPAALRLVEADVHAALAGCPEVRLPASGISIRLPRGGEPCVIVEHQGRPLMRLRPMRAGRMVIQAASKLPGR